MIAVAERERERVSRRRVARSSVSLKFVAPESVNAFEATLRVPTRRATRTRRRAHGEHVAHILTTPLEDARTRAVASAKRALGVAVASGTPAGVVVAVAAG